MGIWGPCACAVPSRRVPASVALAPPTPCGRGGPPHHEHLCHVGPQAHGAWQQRAANQPSGQVPGARGEQPAQPRPPGGGAPKGPAARSPAAPAPWCR